MVEFVRDNPAVGAFFETQDALNRGRSERFDLEQRRKTAADQEAVGGTISQAIESDIAAGRGPSGPNASVISGLAGLGAPGGTAALALRQKDADAEDARDQQALEAAAKGDKVTFEALRARGALPRLPQQLVGEINAMSTFARGSLVAKQLYQGDPQRASAFVRSFMQTGDVEQSVKSVGAPRNFKGIVNPQLKDVIIDGQRVLAAVDRSGRATPVTTAAGQQVSVPVNNSNAAVKTEQAVVEGQNVLITVDAQGNVTIPRQANGDPFGVPPKEFAPKAPGQPETVEIMVNGQRTLGVVNPDGTVTVSQTPQGQPVQVAPKEFAPQRPSPVDQVDVIVNGERVLGAMDAEGNVIVPQQPGGGAFGRPDPQRGAAKTVDVIVDGKPAIGSFAPDGSITIPRAQGGEPFRPPPESQTGRPPANVAYIQYLIGLGVDPQKAILLERQRKLNPFQTAFDAKNSVREAMSKQFPTPAPEQIEAAADQAFNDTLEFFQEDPRGPGAALQGVGEQQPQQAQTGGQPTLPPPALPGAEAAPTGTAPGQGTPEDVTQLPVGRVMGEAVDSISRQPIPDGTKKEIRGREFTVIRGQWVVSK